MKILPFLAILLPFVLTLSSCGDDKPAGSTTKVTEAEAQVLRPLKSLEEARIALDTWKQNRSTRAALEKAMKDHPEWAEKLIEGKLDEIGGMAGKYIPLHSALTKKALDKNISIVAYMVVYAEANNGDYSELNKLLAKKPDVNAYPQDANNSTCMSVGAQVESLNLLIKAGLDVNKPVSLNGSKTALYYARKAKNLPMVQALIDAGAHE